MGNYCVHGYKKMNLCGFEVLYFYFRAHIISFSNFIIYALTRVLCEGPVLFCVCMREKCVMILLYL